MQFKIVSYLGYNNDNSNYIVAKTLLKENFLAFKLLTK